MIKATLKIAILASAISAWAGALAEETLSVSFRVGDPEPISSILEVDDWTPAVDQSVNLGVSGDVVWVRVVMKKPASPDDHLVIENPHLDRVDLYVATGPAVSLAQTRGFLQDNANAFHSRFLVFDARPSHGGPYYFRVVATSPLRVPMAVYSSAALVDKVRVETGLVFGMFAVIFVFAAYNGLIYLSIRRPAFLYYSIYGACVGSLFMTTEGYLPSWLPHQILLSSAHIAGGLGFAALVMFARHLLGTRGALPSLDRAMRACAGACVLVPFGSLLWSSWVWAAIAPILAVSSMGLSFVAALKCARSQPVARVFAGAFFAPLIGTTLYALQMFEVLPTNALTLHSVHLGVCVEVVLFSQALAWEIDFLGRMVRKKSTLLEETNEALKREVAERRKMASEVDRQRAIVIHTAKMREIGTLTAGVAHEIYNPLMVVEAYLRASGHHDAWVEKAPAIMKEAHEESLKMVERIRRTADNMLSMARDSSNEDPGVFSVQGLVGDALHLYRQAIDENGVDVDHESVANLDVLCRKSDVSQILLNLINNAADALKTQNDGRIWIKSRTESKVVQIRVEDNGPGVPEDLVPKLMSESFTTKGPTEGTGLGLGISSILSERNGGSLSYERRDGITAFVIRLPVAA